VFDSDALEELRDSIRAHGVLQPIVVRRVSDGFELIAGERRWRAARLAGLERIPAVVRTDVSDAAMLELALVENVQRRDLNPLERAQGFRQMMSTLVLTQEEVADKVGLRRSTVSNHIRLLGLSDKVQELVGRGLVSMGHARALLGITHPDEQLRLAQQVAVNDLSVRDVERIVQTKKAPSKPSVSSISPPDEIPAPPWAQDMERRIGERLGTRVGIRLTGPGPRGQIVVDFYDRASLERVHALLAPKPAL
jgi:ParB family chromosome partitioning protein